MSETRKFNTVEVGNIQQSAGTTGARFRNLARRLSGGGCETVVNVEVVVVTTEVVVDVVELLTRVRVVVVLVALRSFVCWIVRVFVTEVPLVEVEVTVTVFVIAGAVEVDVTVHFDVEILLLASIQFLLAEIQIKRLYLVDSENQGERHP